MRAERTGQKLHRTIECILKESKIDCMPEHPKFGVGLFGEDIRVDFYIPTVDEFQALELKWQQSGGTAYKTWAYLVYNIKEKYPCKTAILIGGDGYPQGAIDWVRNRVGGNLAAVYTINEFISALNNGKIHKRVIDQLVPIKTNIVEKQMVLITQS